MFVDFRDQVPPAPWEPEPRPRRRPLTGGERRVVGIIVAFNLAMLLLGPLAGATLFDAIGALLRR